MSFADTIQYLGPKLIVALFCGGLIGLERELKNKAAGIKTNMLICVGSMLFTSTSILIAYAGSKDGDAGDPTRIAAQIVSGIGFLGGGAILQSKENIVGLTTAASIWLVAAIGVWIGMGQLEVALFVSVLLRYLHQDIVPGVGHPGEQIFRCDGPHLLPKHFILSGQHDQTSG